MMRTGLYLSMVIGLVVMLGMACGGGNDELERAPQPLAESDLAIMVLPQEDLGDEFANLEVDESSGFSDNEETADNTLDPDDTPGDLDRAGRINGYGLRYSDVDLTALEQGEGIIVVGTSVQLFEDAGAASDFLDKQVGDFQRFEGEQIEAGLTLGKIETFTVDGLADKAIGLRYQVTAGGATVYQTVVAFSLDRLMAAAMQTRVDDDNVNFEVEEIARALQERIEGVLLGKIAGTPVPLPGQSELRQSWRALRAGSTACASRMADDASGQQLRLADEKRFGYRGQARRNPFPLSV